MAFSTETEIKVNKEIERLTGQAGWITAEFDERIREGDTMINACLADMGYDVVAIAALVTVPPLINELSKLYARAAILRDLRPRGPASTTEDINEQLFKTYNDMITKLKERKLVILDAANLEITFVDTTQEILVNTEGVKRALDMGEPEFQEIRTDQYADDETIGNPPDTDNPNC